MCNLYIIFSGTSILKSRKLKLYCCLNDRADFCTVFHMLDKLLLDKFSKFLKFCVNSACRPVILIN